MKRNMKFLCIVLALLLLSSAILTGCMYAIAAENGDAKEYDESDMESRIEAVGSSIVPDDTPTNQAELQKKFSAMSEVSEDGKSITVITKDYLNDFRKGILNREVFCSLSTEEVYFIIQDSIRLFATYDEVVLPEFTFYAGCYYSYDGAEIAAVGAGIFCLGGQVINTERERALRDYDADIEKINEIILYRLQALSSPDAFFSGADALRSVGKNPDTYSSMLPETGFYIPDYSETTDRKYILSVIAGETDFTDLDRFSDLFIFSAWNEHGIKFRAKSDGSIAEVFPTADMKDVPSAT